MRLAVGEPAPTFSVTDLRGDRIALASLDDKPVWLAFFRFASCPLCNLRVHEMLSQWPRFEKRCHFVSVFQSPRERFEGFLSTHEPPFPVIADPELTLFTAYRVESSLKVLGRLHRAVRLPHGLHLHHRGRRPLRASVQRSERLSRRLRVHQQEPSRTRGRSPRLHPLRPALGVSAALFSGRRFRMRAVTNHASVLLASLRQSVVRSTPSKRAAFDLLPLQRSSTSWM